MRCSSSTSTPVASCTTLATITLQNYFRLYDKLGGMTGTAMTEASEFDKIYKLGVVPIRTNKPMVREDQADLVYRTEQAKFNAVIDDIEKRHHKGQPVLVGTASVAKSEHLAELLKQHGIPHTVLNAKQHASEAEVVAMAGRRGAVTVATNMAGRGTDIMLGGNPEFLAEKELRSRDLDPLETPEEYEAAWPSTLEKFQAEVKAGHDEVTDLGGLYVVGTERHESRRIDNQLRGRSGRQGDPGESRFYLSLEDDLMRLFKSDWVDWVLTTLKIPDDVPIENKRVTGAIASAQAQVESQNFETRKNILKYDDVMNRQREVIYTERRRVLEGADLHDQVSGMIDDVVGAYVTAATEGFPEEWDLDRLWLALKTLYPISFSAEQLTEEVGGERSRLTRELLVERVRDDAHASYRSREEELGDEVMRELERRVLLSVLDRKWREHLYEMDYLREGIGLRAYSQRDPLVEYQREGFDLFAAMMDAIKEESVGYLFNLEVQIEEEPEPTETLDAGRVVEGLATGSPQGAPAQPAGAAPAEQEHHPNISAKGLQRSSQPQRLTYSAPTVDGDPDDREVSTQGAATEEMAYAGTPRNAMCPCGSGRKYKRCHGDPTHR